MIHVLFRKLIWDRYGTTLWVETTFRLGKKAWYVLSQLIISYLNKKCPFDIKERTILRYFWNRSSWDNLSTWKREIFSPNSYSPWLKSVLNRIRIFLRNANMRVKIANLIEIFDQRVCSKIYFYSVWAKVIVNIVSKLNRIFKY